MAGGRPRGRMLTDLEVRHLRLLLEIRQRMQLRARDYDELLEDFVLACRESGASARTIAEQLDVSPSAVQQWTQHARARASNRPDAQNPPREDTGANETSRS